MSPSDANELALPNAAPATGEVAAVPAPDPLADLAKQKLKREIEKLDREIEKLDVDVAEARRPYILRNPQTITAALATLGALITIAVATSTNYYGFLREQVQFKSDQAKFSSDQAAFRNEQAQASLDKAKAAQTAADAAQKKADKATQDAAAQVGQALKEQKAANSLSQQAKIQETEAQQKIAADQKRVTQAELQANIANDAAFKATRLPPYLKALQPQLTSINLGGTPTLAFGWLTSPTLKTLGVGSAGSGGPLENAVLATVPASVNDLTIEGRGWTFIPSTTVPAPNITPKNGLLATLDLGVIDSIGSMKRLSLLLGAPELPLLTIQNLAQAKQLEDLDLDVEGQTIVGLEAIEKLPNLKRLRLVIDKPEAVPPAMLAMATSLVLSRSSTGPLLSKDVASQLASARRLKRLEVTTYLDEPTIQQLKAISSLDTLLISWIGSFTSAADAMPQIRSVGLTCGSFYSLTQMFAAFPNARDVYVIVREYTPQDSFDALQSYLDSLPAKYPHLRSLILIASMKTKPASPLKVPFLPELQALSVTVESEGQQAAPIDLSSVNRSSLKWLELEAGALLPGQLGQLQALDTLMLNNPEGAWMTELRPLNKLHGLGINYPISCCDRDASTAVYAREKMNVGPVRDLIANLPLERLYIPSYSIYLDGASRFPKTLRQIDLSSREFDTVYSYAPSSPSLFSRGE